MALFRHSRSHRTFLDIAHRLAAMDGYQDDNLILDIIERRTIAFLSTPMTPASGANGAAVAATAKILQILDKVMRLGRIRRYPFTICVSRREARLWKAYLFGLLQTQVDRYGIDHAREAMEHALMRRSPTQLSNTLHGINGFMGFVGAGVTAMVAPPVGIFSFVVLFGGFVFPAGAVVRHETARTRSNERRRFARLENIVDGLEAHYQRHNIGAGEVVHLPCGHTFHHACISGWLRRQNSCPICRRQGRQLTVSTEVQGACSICLEDLSGESE